MDLMFSKPLKRPGREPGNLRVAALSRFTQLLHRSPHVSLRRKNRSQIQPHPREIRAQPDRLLILRRRFRQLSLSHQKTAKQCVSFRQLGVCSQGRFCVFLRAVELAGAGQRQGVFIEIRRKGGPVINCFFEIEQSLGKLAFLGQRPAGQILRRRIVRVDAQSFPQRRLGAISLPPGCSIGRSNLNRPLQRLRTA